MTFISSADTTIIAINKYNNMLNGGMFDITYMPWTPFSGNSLIKRDDLNPNTLITDDSTPGGSLIAGALNSGNTNTNFSSILAGTGNTIDLFNNKILAGENNLLYSNYSPTDYVGIYFNGSSLIMAGQENNMLGFKYPPEMSVIMNGSANTINNRIQAFNYSDDYKRNSIINGISNSINGIVGNSWIGNGSGNTIQSQNYFFHVTHYGETKGNYILNGHDNIISSTGTTNNYNSIIGGFNNAIINQSNSTVIGSNLTGMTDTTSVNNLLFTDQMFFNDAVFSAYTFTFGSFDHQNKPVCIIQNNCIFGDTNINLSNGTYNGQILFLIAIPYALPTPQPVTYNVILDPSNVISLITHNAFGTPGIIVNNIYSSFTPKLIDPLLYIGLGVFVWDSSINYWIRSDFRGGV